MDLFNRALSLAQMAADRLNSSLTSLTSTSLTPPQPRTPPPYLGPDLLSSLPHELHALIFTYLPLRALFASARLSRTFALLPSHPSTDDLFRRQIFDPTRPSLCTDRPPTEPWRRYVQRVVDVEHRLIGDDASGVKYEVGGCDERVQGPRMFVSMRRGWAANYDPNQAVYWGYENSIESVFSSSLVLRFVSWLEVAVDIDLPTPPTPDATPYRYKVLFRLGVSERSNLGSPTFAAGPAEEDVAYATSVSRVVHNHHLRELIDDRESVVTGVGCHVWGEAEAEVRPAEVEEVGWRPRNQAEALMGGRRRLGMRRRSATEARSRIRAERVMRELLIGVVEVRYKGGGGGGGGGEGGKRGEGPEGKEEKREEAGERTAAAAAVPFRPHCVRMRVQCTKVGPNEGTKSGVAFDCIIAERIP